MISIESVIADRQRLESDIVSLRFALEESQRGRHEAEKRVNRLQWEPHSEAHRGQENDKNADVVNQSLRAEVRQLIIQLVTAHSVDQRILAMLQVKINHTEKHQG